MEKKKKKKWVKVWVRARVRVRVRVIESKIYYRHRAEALLQGLAEVLRIGAVLLCWR